MPPRQWPRSGEDATWSRRESGAVAAPQKTTAPFADPRLGSWLSRGGPEMPVIGVDASGWGLGWVQGWCPARAMGPEGGRLQTGHPGTLRPQTGLREAGAGETIAPSGQAAYSSRGQIRAVSTLDLVHTWVFFPRCEVVTITPHQAEGGLLKDGYIALEGEAGVSVRGRTLRPHPAPRGRQDRAGAWPSALFQGWSSPRLPAPLLASSLLRLWPPPPSSP